MDHITKVSIRAFAIFQLKLLIDGFKDGTVFTVSFVEFAVDLVFKRHSERRYFYRVMCVSEKLNLWFNLYGAAERAEASDDELFRVSAAKSDTLLDTLEQLIQAGDGPQKKLGSDADFRDEI